MYRFRSSDITNDKFLAAIERNGQIVIDRYKNMDIRELQEIIYHSELNQNMYNNLMFALSLADTFNLPATKSEADLLFFVLQVNFAYSQRETKIQIRNISQAYAYYEQSSGHFREVLRQNVPETFYTTFKCQSVNVPNIQFTWSIPIARIIDGETKQPRLNLAGAINAPYAMLSFEEIGIHNLQVPRMYYAQLFNTSFQKGNLFADEQNIKNMASQITEELLEQILSYCGFKKFYNIKKAINFETNYGFDGLVYAEIQPLHSENLEANLLLLEDREFDFNREELESNTEKIIYQNSRLIEDLRVYWKKRNANTYQFLTDAVQYIPVFAKDNFITIWLTN